LNDQNEFNSSSNLPPAPAPTSTSKQTPVHVLEKTVNLSNVEASLPSPRATTPPPESSEPSALVLALTRLADLEAQMEYEFTKYTQLVQRHKRIRAEFEVLETLPVGMEAFQEDFDKLLASEMKSEELSGNLQ
jgi:SPX domain protein involved in polyphosphate accumulation